MTDSLVARTEARRVRASAELVGADQDRLGQYFTPCEAADLVASLPRLPIDGTLRILDVGAGVGSLTASLVARIIREAPGLSVAVTAVEIDPELVIPLKETLADMESLATAAGISVVAQAVQGDFLDLCLESFGLTGGVGQFDLVIMNPPYSKLPAQEPRRVALKRVLVDTPNLYAAFLALGVVALRDGGQIVAITPRSFMNGTYFETFRKWLLKSIALNRVHIFESRASVFSDTRVLQENVVFCGTRGANPSLVTITSSHDHNGKITEFVRPYAQVVLPADPRRFIRIGLNEADSALADKFASLPARLPDLGLKVSTGRVVDFRSRKNLRDMPKDGDRPLIYPGNLRGGRVVWPASIRKPQAFAITSDEDFRKFLVPEGVYVVVKRFSAKEERRRIVAAVWDPKFNGPGEVAFENHLNVFHMNGAGMERQLALGLVLWLNGSPVDRFFRTFSGHTQVNATDLKSLSYPSIEKLRVLGQNDSGTTFEQAEIDELCAIILRDL